jgi:D-amino-acid oxidase
VQYSDTKTGASWTRKVDKIPEWTGQTCLVANKCDATVTRQNADGTWTFCVPRNFDGGTIIGGTKEPDNWDPLPSLENRKQLLTKFAATYPAILSNSGGKGFRVIRDIVGRRPTRHGGIRLEIERLPDKKSVVEVVHAYGLGGRGYELSWGVALEVELLVLKAIEGFA